MSRLLLIFCLFLIPCSPASALPEEKVVEIRFKIVPETSEFFIWGSAEDAARDQAIASGVVNKAFVLERETLLQGPVSITFRADGYFDESRNFDLSDLAQNSGLIYIPPDKRPLALTKKPSLALLYALGGGCALGLMAAFVAFQRKKQSELRLEVYRANSQKLQLKVTELSGLMDGLRGLSKGFDEKGLFLELRDMLSAAVSHEVAVVIENTGKNWTVIHKWPDLSDKVFERVPLPTESQITKMTRVQRGDWPNHLLIAPLSQEPARAVLIGRSSEPFNAKDQDLTSFCLFQTKQTLDNSRLLEQAEGAKHEFESSQQKLLQVTRMNAIGDLGAGVAHELNTPLGAISLSLEGSMAMLKDVPKPVEKLLKTGLEAIENCQTIIDRLLTFSRDGIRENETLNLKQLGDESFQLLQHKAQEKQIQFISELEPSLTLKGRPNEIRQLLQNLLKNALDASADNSTITLRAESSEGKLRLHVIDRGHGIEKDDLGKIFGPFFSTRSVAQGRGLGLSICEEIAIRHSASIQVQSTVGLGSVFTVVFETEG